MLFLASGQKSPNAPSLEKLTCQICHTEAVHSQAFCQTILQVSLYDEYRFLDSSSVIGQHSRPFVQFLQNDSIFILAGLFYTLFCLIGRCYSECSHDLLNVARITTSNTDIQSRKNLDNLKKKEVLFLYYL